MNSKKPHSFHNFETITRYAGLALVTFFLAGPVSVVLARVLARTIPLAAFIESATSYSPSRIRSENIRIVTEVGDYFYFALFLISVGIVIGTFLFVGLNASDSTLPIKHLLSRLSSTRYLYPIFLLLLFLHFATLHKWKDALDQRHLDGFGTGPSIVAIGISIIMFKYRNNLISQLQISLKPKLQKLLFLICALIFIPQIPAFGRAIGHTREYGIAFNSYAAPAAGLLPFQSYAPSYTTLSGYILRPVITIAGNANVIRVSILYHMFLSALLIFVLIWLSKRLLRCNLVFAALTAAVLISPRTGVQAAGFLPSIANGPRYLIPLLVLILATYFLEKRKPSVSLTVLLGLLLALTMINNTEIGIPLVLSILITLGFKVFADGSFARNFLMVSLVAIATFTGLLYLLSDGQLKQGGQYWLLWVISRGSGGYINAVPLWGLHQFALSIHSATLLFGVLIVTLKKGEELAPDLKVNSLMGVATGLFGLFTFPYFLGGSGFIFLPTPLWLPLVLTTIALIGLLKAIWLTSESKLETSHTNSRYFSPLHLGISSLLFCSLMFVPDPQNVVGVHFRRDAVAWTTKTFMAEPVVQSVINVAAETSDTSRIAYYGEYGNLISLLTGIKSVYGVDDPGMAYSSRKSLTVTCRPISLTAPDLVYASKRFIPVEFLDSRALNGPCPGLLRDTTFESDFLIRYVNTP
jgi:hypothetical protein